MKHTQRELRDQHWENANPSYDITLPLQPPPQFQFNGTFLYLKSPKNHKIIR